jgi:hypothetical protein
VESAPGLVYARKIQFTRTQELNTFNLDMRIIHPEPPVSLVGGSIRDIWAVGIGEGVRKRTGGNQNPFTRCSLWRHTGPMIILRGMSGSPVEVISTPGKVPPVASILGFQNMELQIPPTTERVERDDEEGTVAAMTKLRHSIYACFPVPKEVREATITVGLDAAIPL